jgi:hypothetical protein
MKESVNNKLSDLGSTQCVRFGPPDDFKSLYSASFYCWFQWWAVSISLLITSHQLSLSLLTISALAAVCTNLQHSTHSHISLVFPSQHHYSRLNHFRMYFVDNKFEKIN